MYLEVHSGSSEEDKMKVCSGLNYEKLSSKACRHLAQNKKFPSKSAGQALITQQVKLKSFLEETNQVSPYLDSPCSFMETENPDQQIVIYVGKLDLSTENEELKEHLQGMRWRVLELEKVCRKMQNQMAKMLKSRVPSHNSARVRRAYTPLWPEGLPERVPVQAILDWQRRTMQMMYTDIIQALKAKGVVANRYQVELSYLAVPRSLNNVKEMIPGGDLICEKGMGSMSIIDDQPTGSQTQEKFNTQDTSGTVERCYSGGKGSTTMSCFILLKHLTSYEFFILFWISVDSIVKLVVMGTMTNKTRIRRIVLPMNVHLLLLF